jgi:hypothetical protein
MKVFFDYRLTFNRYPSARARRPRGAGRALVGVEALLLPLN